MAAPSCALVTSSVQKGSWAQSGNNGLMSHLPFSTPQRSKLVFSSISSKVWLFAPNYKRCGPHAARICPPSSPHYSVFSSVLGPKLDSAGACPKTRGSPVTVISGGQWAGMQEGLTLVGQSGKPPRRRQHSGLGPEARRPQLSRELRCGLLSWEDSKRAGHGQTRPCGPTRVKNGEKDPAGQEDYFVLRAWGKPEVTRLIHLLYAGTGLEAGKPAKLSKSEARRLFLYRVRWY